MATYMLLLHESTTGYEGISPEEMQEIIRAYGAWAGRMAEAGRLKGGEKLADDAGRVLRGSGGDLQVTDGPYSETKEIVGGYFLIEADGYDHAVELVKDCPHLGYGGTIELREVEPTNPDGGAGA